MAEARFITPPHSLTQAGFLTAFGGIYEHSPWVAEHLWDEGIGPADTVVSYFAARMAAAVDAADEARKMALLRAHPELAGKLAVGGGLSAESTAEQAGAGLDRCSPKEFAAFTTLNDRYGARFGHPFIIAVRGLDRAAILAAFTARVDNDPATEFTTAIAEVHKIARLRLELLADQG
jgi:2-oxo-4-hydroxy-4-carboxy-5-ureidoimidazoline decarboxylase